MLADHYKNGDIPKEAITYQEEQGRQAFEDGKLLFLRNWPYVYNLAKTDGSLQGQGQVRRGTAARRRRPRRLEPRRSQRGHQRLLQAQGAPRSTFLKFIEEDAQQKFFMEKGSLAPVVGALYEDKALVAKYPYLPTLLTVDPERRAATGHAVLPGGDQGDPGQRLRRHQG